MRHILIVDDEPLVRRRVRALLVELAEMSITEAGTVKDAMTYLKTGGRWSLVILDIGLPDGSGLHVLQKLRETDKTTPVLVFSARDADEYRPLVLGLGASAFVEKGSSGDDFLLAVSFILEAAAA